MWQAEKDREAINPISRGKAEHKNGPAAQWPCPSSQMLGPSWMLWSVLRMSVRPGQARVPLPLNTLEASNGGIS